MQIIEKIRQARTLLDTARTTGLGDLAGVEIAQLVRDLQSLITTAQALQLDATLAADAAQVAHREGAGSTSAFLAQTTGVSLAQAAREVKLAHDLAKVAPATREAFVAPGMSKDKMTVLTQAMNRLPHGLGTDDRARVEADLVVKAGRLSLEDFRRAARRALEVIDAAWADTVEGQTLVRQEQAARSAATLWMNPPDDHGLVKGGFTIPVTHGAVLKNVLEALSSPKQDQYLDDPAETGANVDYPHKLGRAFCQLLERLPVDDLPLHGGMPATLVINLDYQQLLDGLGAATISSTGDRISLTEIRRIACEARILPQVLGTNSVPLDLGRDERLHTRHHRLSLTAKYAGCAFPDCHAPPAWCDIHHTDFWKHGGTTTLHRAIPLCKRHHNLIHQEQWTAHINAQGWAEFIPPSWLDPTQKPRQTTRYRPIPA